MDLVRVVLFLGAIYVPWLIASRARDRPLVEAGLIAAVLALAQVVGVAQILGLMRALQPLRAVSANLVASSLVVGVLLVRRARGSSEIAVAMAEQSPVSSKYQPAIAALAVLSIVGVAVVVAWAHAFPPAGYDDLNYHMPMVAAMRQYKSWWFGTMPSPAIDGYPKHIEMFLFSIGSASGNFRLVAIGQLPLTGMGVLSAVVIATRLGSAPRTGLFAGLIFPFAPVVLSQLFTTYVDVAVAAPILASVALCLVAGQDRRWICWTSFGACVGITAGSKGSGMVYGCLILLLFAYRAVGTGDTWAIAIGRTLRPVAVGVCLGISNFAKNAIVYRNPFYPMRFMLGGRVLLDGPWTIDGIHGYVSEGILDGLRRVMNSWSSVRSTAHDALLGGLGVTWLWLLACLCVSTVLSLRLRDTRRMSIYGLGVAMLLATPLVYRVRFVLFVLGFGCVALAHVLDSAGPRGRFWITCATILIAALALIQTYGKRIVWLATASQTDRAIASDIVNYCSPVSHRRAIRALRNVSRAPDSRIRVFYSGVARLFAFCFWNSSLSNTVTFHDTEDSDELDKYRADKHGTLWYVPKGSAVHAYIEAHWSSFKSVHEDPSVSIVVTEAL